MSQACDLPSVERVYPGIPKTQGFSGNSGNGRGSYFEKRSGLFVKVTKQVTGQEQEGSSTSLELVSACKHSQDQKGVFWRQRPVCVLHTACVPRSRDCVTRQESKITSEGQSKISPLFSRSSQSVRVRKKGKQVPYLLWL